MDFKIWSTSKDHYRSSTTVWWQVITSSQEITWDRSIHDDCISSSIERTDRATQHRTLKAALMCHLMDDPSWVDALPLVLLRMRSALKEDMNATSAQMLYGTNIRLPGEFFTETPVIQPETFVQKLQQHFRSVKPVQTSHHGSKNIFVH